MPVEQSCRLCLDAWHQVAVEVEGDLDRRMAHEGRERLGVDARGDHERGIGMASLMKGAGARSDRPRPKRGQHGGTGSWHAMAIRGHRRDEMIVGNLSPLAPVKPLRQ